MIFKTRNTTYTLIDCGDGAFLISGNQKYCPVPVPCRLAGPVEVGGHVHFNTYAGTPISKWVTTSTVVEILES